MVDKVSQRTESRTNYPPGRPQGSPPRSRPYHDTPLCDTPRSHGVIITHIFWSISVNRGDKAFRMVAFVHKLCPVIPLHKRPQKDMGNDDPCGRPAGGSAAYTFSGNSLKSTKFARFPLDFRFVWLLYYNCKQSIPPGGRVDRSQESCGDDVSSDKRSISRRHR